MASKISSHGLAPAPASSTELYYEQEGNPNGPAVLFVHGLGGTTNTFQPLVHALQDCNLVRFDFSGHGRSTLPKLTSIASYVDDCEAIIKHFNLENITVVAHSLGGLIALQLAAKQPKLVSKLVLFGPVKALAQAGKDGCNARAAAVRKGGMAACADTVIGNALAAETLKSKPAIVGYARELLCRQNAEGYALACEALANGEDPEWSAIKAETTIISGAEDKVSAPATCKAISESLGGAKVITFEGVAHWHTLENAVEAAQVVKKALQ